MPYVPRGRPRGRPKGRKLRLLRHTTLDPLVSQVDQREGVPHQFLDDPRLMYKLILSQASSGLRAMAQDTTLAEPLRDTAARLVLILSQLASALSGESSHAPH